VYSLGDKIQVVVREIDDRGKVSLDVAGAEVPSGDGGSAPQARSEGNGESRDRGDRDRGRDRGPRERGGRDGGDRDRGSRDRKGDRGGDRAGKPSESSSKPGRTVVSFEDDFESGI
jgi:polyribonucleotide nucleotidyltransferase